MAGRPRARYLGLDELDGAPHVVLDGAPRGGTVTTLSHWPASPTPRELAHDLSAEIAMAYVARGGADADIATVDHLDVDGLVSLYTLTNPDDALVERELLVEVARVGDFGSVRQRRAAEVTWALEALIADPSIAVVDLPDTQVTREGTTTRMYRSLLAVLPAMLEGRDQDRVLASAAATSFDASCAAIDSGAIEITEVASADLCVVTVSRPVDGVLPSPSRVDECAVHSTTDAARVLVISGGEFTYYDRYESWVRFVSRDVAKRRDMASLARAFEAVDTVEWSSDPPSAVRPVMRSAGQSSLASDEVVERLVDHLATAPEAWDPWDRVRPLRG